MVATGASLWCTGPRHMSPGGAADLSDHLMGHTCTALHDHIVFSTKDRAASIRPESQTRLHPLPGVPLDRRPQIALFGTTTTLFSAVLIVVETRSSIRPSRWSPPRSRCCPDHRVCTAGS